MQLLQLLIVVVATRYSSCCNYENRCCCNYENRCISGTLLQLRELLLQLLIAVVATPSTLVVSLNITATLITIAATLNIFATPYISLYNSLENYFVLLPIVATLVLQLVQGILSRQNYELLEP
jgi:hypothetical protein